MCGASVRSPRDPAHLASYPGLAMDVRVYDDWSHELYDAELDGPYRPLPPALRLRSPEPVPPAGQFWTDPLVRLFGLTMLVWLLAHLVPTIYPPEGPPQRENAEISISPSTRARMDDRG